MPSIHYMFLQKLKTHKIEIIAARPHFLVWQMNQIDSKNNIKSRKYLQLKENHVYICMYLSDCVSVSKRSCLIKKAVF